MRPVLKSVALLAVLFVVPALAKGPATHQCSKDGAVIQKKKKECAAEGGKWEPIPLKATATKSSAK